MPACVRTPTLFATFSLLALAGCSEPFGPPDVAGVYALEGTLEQSAFGHERRVLADTIDLRTDRIAMRRTYAVELDEGQPVGPVILREAAFDYRVGGRVVALRFRCPPNANCVITAPELFEADGERLRPRTATSQRCVRIGEH